MAQDTALSHLRILELGGALPASYAGHFLADLGADVVKVEPPGGALERFEPPFLADTPGPDRSLAFIHVNASKRGILLDFTKPEDRQVVLDLARTVDAIVEAFPVGYLDSLGLGYEQIRAVNPGVIVTSLTPFGQTGPFRGFKGNNGIAEAMGGVIFTLGDNTRPPVVSPNNFVTQIAGVHGAAATLSAIYARRNGVGGQQIDVSLQDVATQIQTGLPEYALRRLIRRRPGAGSLFGPASIYRTKDGYCFLMPGQPNMWKAMVDWMQDPLLAGPEWGEREYQNQNADVMRMLIGNFVADMTTAECVEEAQRRGIPSAPVNSIPQFVDSDQVKALGSFTPKAHPVLGDYTTVDFMHLSASPIAFRSPAPTLDQHRADILAEAKASRTQPVRGEALEPRISATQSASSDVHPSRAFPTLSGSSTGRTVAAPTPSPAAGEGRDGGRQIASPHKGPLEGIRVLDFTRVIAGPAGTQVLGFLGVDVLKVESKGLGTGREPSAGYPEINRAKKSITLDIRSPEGRDLVLRLAEKSDIVINNFSAFVMDRMGLGYDDLTKVKKDIVYIRMPGFGRTGPAKDWVAYGQMLQCFTGLVSVWKHPETEMTSALKGPVADYISSSSVTLASLAAIEYRDRTGRGQIIDLNMLEALAAMFNPLYMDYMLNKRAPQPVGYRNTRYAPYGAYPCRGDDAWCVIAVETEEEWWAFRKAVGEPGWVFDERFRTKAGRIEHREELDAHIATWTKEYTKHQVMHFLQRDGIPAGSVQSAEDLFYDYHLRKRGHIVEVANPSPWGTFDLYGTPMRFSLTPGSDTVPTPTLGQHNEEVFKGLLGLSPEEYERLVQARAIY